MPSAAYGQTQPPTSLLLWFTIVRITETTIIFQYSPDSPSHRRRSGHLLLLYHRHARRPVPHDFQRFDPSRGRDPDPGIRALLQMYNRSSRLPRYTPKQ